MKNVAIKKAYLSLIGKISSINISMYYFFVFLDVGVLKHFVSQQFLKHLIKKDRANSVIGVAILKIIVRIMIDPIFSYQSAVKSSYLPRNRKLISYKVRDFL
jgi:hypothetical protein